MLGISISSSLTGYYPSAPVGERSEFAQSYRSYHLYAVTVGIIPVISEHAKAAPSVREQAAFVSACLYAHSAHARFRAQTHALSLMADKLKQ